MCPQRVGSRGQLTATNRPGIGGYGSVTRLPSSGVGLVGPSARVPLTSKTLTVSVPVNVSIFTWSSRELSRWPAYLILPNRLTWSWRDRLIKDNVLAAARVTRGQFFSRERCRLLTLRHRPTAHLARHAVRLGENEHQARGLGARVPQANAHIPRDIDRRPCANRGLTRAKPGNASPAMDEENLLSCSHDGK